MSIADATIRNALRLPLSKRYWGVVAARTALRLNWASMTALIASIVLLTGCTSPDSAQIDSASKPEVRSTEIRQEATSSEASRVLVVINRSSPASTEIGAYYRSRREIPRSNTVVIDVSTTEEISEGEYRSGIEDPVRKAIEELRGGIDYIVLTKGVPIRIQGRHGYSVDGHLSAMDTDIRPIEALEEEQIRRSANPYFGSERPFSRAEFGIYLVTRLDGFTVEDAKRLVDNSLAAEAHKGPFFFDAASNRNSGGYLRMQQSMFRAEQILRDAGFDASVNESAEFTNPGEPLAGYVSWGSNDSAFDRSTFRSLRFKPGAIAETFVSTSARTFQNVSGGQSLIGDLIEGGVTGVKGYVSEPYTFALALPEILFDRYTSGFNLAESFYAASLVVKWKDVVIGDPLCRPYRPSS